MKRLFLLLSVLIIAVATFFLFRTYIINVEFEYPGDSVAKSGDIKKISFIHWGEFPKEIFNLFSKKYPNILVKFERFDEQYYPTLQKIRIASGNDLDVMGIMSCDYNDLVEKGYLVDLSGQAYLNNYKTEVRDAVKSFQKDGKEYAIAYKSTYFGIWYNKTLFSKYNIALPETYNEFMQACKKFKANDISPMIVGARDEWAGSYICLLRFLSITDRDKNWFEKIKIGKTKWSDSEMRSALMDINAFLENGYLNENSIHLTYHQAFSEFTKGRAAMIITDNRSLSLLKEGIDKICDPGVMAIPYNSPDLSEKVAGNRGDYLTGIFSESKKITQSKLLLDFLSSREAAQIYSNETMSVPTINEADVNDLKYNRLWESLRKAELITSGINELDHEMLKAFNSNIKQMISRNKTYQQVISDLDSKAYELYSK